MKPITELLIKKHLGGVEVRKRWFGGWDFVDPKTGLRGRPSLWGGEVEAPGKDTEAATYLPGISRGPWAKHAAQLIP